MFEHHTVKRGRWRWHVVTSGPEDAPPALLLHCWSGNWELWADIMRALNGHFRFIAPDHLGFGESDKPRQDHAYRIDQQAERSLYLLRHFGYERAHVMGHSMGGQIALTLAATYPEAVEKLIVLDPPVSGALHPATRLFYGIFAGVRLGLGKPFTAFVRLGQRFPQVGLMFMRMYFSDPYRYPEAATYWAGRTIAQGQLYSGAWAQLAIHEWNVVPLLSRITAPTLAIWGSLDRIVDVSEAEHLEQHISHVRVERLPQVGHFPMIEAPGRTLRLISDFWGVAERKTPQ